MFFYLFFLIEPETFKNHFTSSSKKQFRLLYNFFSHFIKYLFFCYKHHLKRNLKIQN
jgi:hypothetical protein